MVPIRSLICVSVRAKTVALRLIRVSVRAKTVALRLIRVSVCAKTVALRLIRVYVQPQKVALAKTRQQASHCSGPPGPLARADRCLSDLTDHYIATSQIQQPQAPTYRMFQCYSAIWRGSLVISGLRHALGMIPAQSHGSSRL